MQVLHCKRAGSGYKEIKIGYLELHIFEKDHIWQDSGLVLRISGNQGLWSCRDPGVSGYLDESLTSLYEPWLSRVWG